MVEYEAMKSVPSQPKTLRFGWPETSREISPPGVSCSTGTEIAQPLSWIRKITGRLSRHAALIASQNSPSLVAPSPQLVIVTASEAGSSSLLPCAQPTAGSNCVPVADEGETMCSAGMLQCEG